MPRFSTADSTDWLITHDPLAVVPWDDPVVENLGYAPRSVYVETYWLPVLGPSATWAMRRLTAWLDAEPTGYELSLADLGRELGLGAGTGKNAAVIRTLSRLVAFGMATPFGHALAVRRMLAPLTQRQVRTLPAALAAQHEAEGSGVVRPIAQPLPAPVDTTLCDTTPLVTIGNGTADRSGKPTAVPPPTAAYPTQGATR